MAALAWTMVAIGIWHFTVYLPDRFWQGIVGAFVGAVLGAFIFGFIVNGFDVPGNGDPDLIQAFVAVPGTLIGLGVVWLVGVRQESAGTVEPSPSA